MDKSTVALNYIKRLTAGAAPYYTLGLMLLILAYLLSAATQDSSVLNDLFLPIFAIGIASTLLLIALLGRSLIGLYQDYKHKKSGSKLTTRLVGVFAILILVSTSIVYSFSIHFLHRGINSWFDVQVEQALDDSLELSRRSFGIRMRTLLRQTRLMAGVLSELPASDVNHSLRELTQLSGALEMSLWSMDAQLITTSVENPAIIIPSRPNDGIFSQIEQGEDYINLEPNDDDILQLRVAVAVPISPAIHQPQLLQVIFAVDEHLSNLGHTVQKAYADYKELSYLRKPLISLFTLTLSLIVLLTLLASIWFAIWLSRRIVAPLQDLAQAAQAVASGNYNTIIETTGHDEIGFLVRSFNQMIHRLTQARHATQHSHQQLEQQTTYLSAVLASLSSGVITLDNNHILQTANIASSKILQLNLLPILQHEFSPENLNNDRLTTFVLILHRHIKLQKDWQQQIELQHKTGLQTLMCRGTLLPDNAGWVIVFDDVSTLLQAQRNAAWGEVAQRLAHEIKNPLTPIQLSAERLQYKYLPLVPEDQSKTLTKLTSTIVKQVQAMKEMVNDFSDYARNPGLQRQNISIGSLLREILTLYKSNENHHFTLVKADHKITINLDGNRFRQVLHNLLKNAIEASEQAQLNVDIIIHYHHIDIDGKPWLEITFHDHGPGIPDDMVNNLFEPYATNKQKGTGLGLAIVKKIIEEHDGHVWAENLEHGACITIRLPIEENVHIE